MCRPLTKKENLVAGSGSTACSRGSWCVGMDESDVMRLMGWDLPGLMALSPRK